MVPLVVTSTRFIDLCWKHLKSVDEEDFMFECHKCDTKFVTKNSLNYHIFKLHTQSKKLDAFEKNSDPRPRNMAALNVKRDFTVKYAL